MSSMKTIPSKANSLMNDAENEIEINEIDSNLRNIEKERVSLGLLKGETILQPNQPQLPPKKKSVFSSGYRLSEVSPPKALPTKHDLHPRSN